jgi:dipeptidyl aminopeptidase/acylaminoacyl peptidase
MVIASADGRTTYASLPTVSDFQWSPDGGRFAYVSSDGSRATIRVASRDGSGDFVLAEGYNPDWSPEGERIAFMRAGVPFIIDVDGSNEQQLAGSVFPMFGNAKWAPDGRVLFSFNSFADTFVVQADGGVPTRLLPGYSPRWSPNGDWIAFTWADPRTTGIGGGGELFVMSPGGSSIRQIGVRLAYSDVVTGCSFAELQWSMDSSGLGIDAGFDGTMMTSIEPGSIPRKLGRGCSALSPDLTKEAVAVRNTPEEPCSVVVRGVDEAADRGGTADCNLPKWSPDGSMIAYRSDDQILAIPATGGSVASLGSLRTHGYSRGDIEWSPDATRIAYLDESTIQVADVRDPAQVISLPRPEGYTNDAFVAGSDGYGPDAAVSEAAWSPDGTAIAFTLRRGADLGGGPYGTSEIYVTAADGSGVPRRLARGYDPHWSPDGSLVVFTRDAYY